MEKLIPCVTDGQHSVWSYCVLSGVQYSFRKYCCICACQQRKLTVDSLHSMLCFGHLHWPIICHFSPFDGDIQEIALPATLLFGVSTRKNFWFWVKPWALLASLQKKTENVSIIYMACHVLLLQLKYATETLWRNELHKSPLCWYHCPRAFLILDY